MAWASEADVLAVTGTTVDAATVARAQAVVELYANRTEDATAGLRARDLGWLKRAVAWQAAWLPDQPGYAGRSNAVRVDQDGIEIERDTEHSATLAPLAARALKNLSWKASNTRRARDVRLPVGAPVVDFTTESSDWRHGWAPL